MKITYILAYLILARPWEIMSLIAEVAAFYIFHVVSIRYSLSELIVEAINLYTVSMSIMLVFEYSVVAMLSIT